jgi:hypothetical protein
LKKEKTRSLRNTMKSELNAKYKITAIGTLGVILLRFTFGVINWRLEDYKNN